MDKKTLVVYHVKTPSTICFDGFCAATIAWMKYGDSAEYLPVLYHKDIPTSRFVDRDVIFVDFSYDVERMDKIAEVAHSLLVLDHHMPKSGTFEGRSYAIFRENECGALITWKHFMGDRPVPTMLEIIDDGDRFLNVHPDIDPFHASLALEEPSFQRWAHLIQTLNYGSKIYNEFVARGRILVQYDKKRVELLARDAFPITLCGVAGLAVNSNKFYAHYTGIRLAEYSKTFGAVFYLRADGNVEVSLRRVDPDIDVEVIAKEFGGGGHKGAAAFSVSMDKFKELIHAESRNEFSHIDTATKLFQHTLATHKYTNIEEAKQLFLQHMQSELGSNHADYLEFDITESVGHPNLWARMRSYIALLLGLPTATDNLTRFKRLFPYVEKKGIAFDEDSIRDVLRESRAKSADNSFLVERLLETVKISKKYELATSIYYIHVTVKLPGSKLTVKHTFEVVK